MQCRFRNPPISDFHQVQGVSCRTDEEELHDGVVEADIGTGQEVDVARQEDDEVQRLRLEGDAAT
jgi:hypothetical protein